MESNLIFYPVVAQIILTFGMFIKLAIVKSRALENDEVDLDRRALHSDAWPDSVLKITNNLNNQFETPVLFYALCFMLWALNSVTFISFTVACLFVLLRVIHIYVHTGSNFVPVRKKVFMASTILLMLLCALVVKGLLMAN